MMSKKTKRMLAGMLALTMVLGMNVTAFAVTGDTTGTGTASGDASLEGHVDKDVIEVVLPTSESTENIFDFTLDPEGLIAATEHEKYPDAQFTGDTGVYFLTETNKWTENSTMLKVTNMGTVDVDITLAVQATVDQGITVVDDKSDFDGNAANLYLGLVVDGTVAATDAPVAETAVTTGTAASLVAGLKGNADNYEITYDETDGYAFSKKSSVVDTAWNSFEFGLTGACDTDADWSAVTISNSKVDVTWSYAQAAEENASKMLKENATDATANAAPSIAVTEYTLVADTPIEVAVNLGNGDLKATAVTSVTYNGSEFLGKNMTYADGVINISESAVNALLTKTNPTLIVTFNDEAGTTETITFVTE